MAIKLTMAIIFLISAIVAVILSRSNKDTWKIWIGIIIGAILGFNFALACVYLQLVYAIAQI